MKITLSSKQWVLPHLILVLLLALSMYQFFEVKNTGASLDFLNVGQGDAILIQTKDRKNILIDAGPDGKVVEELSKKLPFFRQKIDLFILTHPDLDHYGGAMDILEKYPVDKILLTGISSHSNLYLSFLNELKDKNIPILFPQNHLDLQISEDLIIDFVYPQESQSLIGQKTRNKNNTSISIVLRNAKREGLALLTGDAEEAQEVELLLSGQDLKAPIFKLGHHGSKTSNTPGMLSAARAISFVVSAGLDNKFGHPDQEVLDRLLEKDIRYTHKENTSFDL